MGIIKYYIAGSFSANDLIGRYGNAGVYAQQISDVRHNSLLNTPFRIENVQSLRNAEASGALAYQLSLPNTKLLAIDFDFMGAANHIDVNGAETPKLAIFAELHDSFKGKLTIYQDGGKVYIAVHSKNSLEALKVKVDRVLSDPHLYEYVDTKGHVQNVHKQLSRPVAHMLGTSVSEHIPGSDVSQTIDTAKAATKKGLLENTTIIRPTDYGEIRSRNMAQFTQQLDHQIIRNIQGNSKAYMRALAELENMLPDNFRNYLNQAEMNGLNPNTKEMLFQASLDKWTVRQFNTNVGQPGETLVYSKNAVIKYKDTLNQTTQHLLKKSLKAKMTLFVTANVISAK